MLRVENRTSTHVQAQHCCPNLAKRLQHQAPTKRSQHLNTTYRNIVERKHIVCVWPPCCEVLRYVGCCWLKFENGQIVHSTFVEVARCCGRLARFAQQCCVWACALVRFSIPSMSQHVATLWPNARNILRPPMLRSFVRGLKTCVCSRTQVCQ